MSAFEYIILDKNGKEKKGILEGDTAKQIRQTLRDQGLTPLSVSQITRSQKSEKNAIGFSSKRGISSLDLALITRQLAALLKSSLPIEEALRSVAKQTEKHRIERILLSVRSKIREGHSFADGLADFPNVFPEIYQKTVKAGEETGHLDLILERLADYTENKHKIKQKTTLALIYPVLLTIVALGIVSALLAFVVPDIVQVFESVERKLPLITRGLIATSDFVQDYWVAMLISLAATVILGKILLDQPLIKFAWHRSVLKLPMIGKLVRTLNSARFSRTLGILSASNVPILDALRISGDVMTNLPMCKAVKTASIKVREGSSLNHALEQTGYFPPMTMSLIASGEASGNLDEMLQRSADIQEREVESFISTLLGLFEPLLILFMGGVVMLIVLGLMIPIVDMNSFAR